MKRLLLLGGIAALGLALFAAPAQAHGDDDRDRYDRGYRSGYERDGYRRHGALDSSRNRKDRKHDREHDRLEDRHDRAHDRGFRNERQHDRWHDKASNRHDVIHHRIYRRHAPERRRRR